MVTDEVDAERVLVLGEKKHLFFMGQAIFTLELSRDAREYNEEREANHFALRSVAGLRV